MTRAGLVVALGAAVVGVLTACTLALPSNERQCSTHADCAELGAGYLCARDGVCVALTVRQRVAERSAASECTEHAQCAASVGLALCSDGRCRSLNEEAAGCVSLDWGTVSPPDGAEVVPIGMLVPADELRAGRPRRVTGAISTALRELNRARLDQGIQGLPALVGVACDESRPESIQYLVQALHTRLIIGPTLSRNVAPLLERTGDEALVLAPFADAPDLLPRPSDSPAWLVSCRANRSHVRAYFFEAVAEAKAQIAALGAPGMDPFVAVLAVSGDAASVGFADGFDDERLRAAQVARVGYTVEGRGLGLLSSLSQRTPRPNLVVAASAEDEWQDNIAAYDGATYATSQVYPYYLLADKRSSLRNRVIQEISTVAAFPRQYRRLLGLDYHRTEESRLMYATFVEAFARETLSAAEPGLEYAYDCAYVGVYAMAAAALHFDVSAAALSPPAIALGLAALQGGGPRVPVRALDIDAALAALAQGKGAGGSLDLIGTSGELDFSLAEPATGTLPSSRQYYEPAPPDGELYCIDANTAEFCDTGITFPASGGSPQRGVGACACLTP